MFQNKPNYTNIISYHGPINLDLTSFVGNFIRESVNADRKIITRIFKVYLELVQNISNYSAQINKRLTEKEANHGVGWFSIDEGDDVYEISTGNLINKEHGPVLIENCDQINALEVDQLRELKRRTRWQSDLKDVGAHIGLIHTGIISNNPLDIEISPIDDKHSFFRITVKVNKAINN